MEGHEDTRWDFPPKSIKYIKRKWRQIVSEGTGTTWLGYEMWFQLWRLKLWVFCVTLNIHWDLPTWCKAAGASSCSVYLGWWDLHRNYLGVFFLFIGILKSSNGMLRVYIAVEHRVIGIQDEYRRKNTKFRKNRRKEGRKAMMFCWSKFTDWNTKRGSDTLITGEIVTAVGEAPQYGHHMASQGFNGTAWAAGWRLG